MKINYKGIDHEVTEDAPFIGARVLSTACNFRCKGCQNKYLKKAPSIQREAEEIIAEIKSNPFNEGIIFGGLEWSLQILDMIELIKLAVANELQIMIYTGCELHEFHERIGIAYEYPIDVPAVLGGADAEVHSAIGRVALDYLIPYTYYIKTGLYDKDNRVTDNIQFGVTLASANQKICKILGEE